MTADDPLHHPRHTLSRRLRVSTDIALLLVLIGAGTNGLSFSARAEPGFAGRYSGRGEGLVTLTLGPPTRDARGEGYRLTAETAIRNNCTGTLTGIARPAGPGQLRLLTPNGDPEETCTLALRFSPDRRQVRVEETSCSYFHGTSCSFEGTLQRR